MDDKSLIKTLIFSFLLFSLFFTSSAQTNCSTYAFSSNRLYATCTNLPYLNAFLHWTYHPSNNSADIAYRHTGVDTSTWVAWALNPSGGSKMPGAQALVALHNSSGQLQAYTSSIPTGNAGYSTPLAPSSLTFQVPTLTADYTSTVMIIYATLLLPTGQTSFNQIWQDGPVSGGSPVPHSSLGDHLKSAGTVDFVTGQTTAAGNGLQRRKNVHGVLNAVSWGTLMPLGAMIARYLKVFKSADPAWFYLHIACQCSAYIIGVAGWATGLKLGSDTGIVQTTHRNIGITLFCLATLQVFALLLRPKKDHKYRLFWNIYHWSVGYVTIILSIVNIFEGLNILDPGKKWKRAYISILIFLGFNAAMLEAYTWYLFVKRRKKTGSEKHPSIIASGTTNGVNGAYGARSHSQQV